MGSKEWMQGMVTFAALAGTLQAVAQGALAIQDIIFLVLVTAFFIALEHDYNKYKLRVGEKNKDNTPTPGESNFDCPSLNDNPLPRIKYYPLRIYLSLNKLSNLLFFPRQLIFDKHGLLIHRY